MKHKFVWKHDALYAGNGFDLLGEHLDGRFVPNRRLLEAEPEYQQEADRFARIAILTEKYVDAVDSYPHGYESLFGVLLYGEKVNGLDAHEVVNNIRKRKGLHPL